jgi:hypothetical protein
MIRHGMIGLVLFTVLTSGALAGEVVALVRLRQADAGGALVNDAEFTSSKETQAQLINSLYILKKAVAALDQETLNILGEEDPVAALERRLQVEFPGRSEIMKVRLPGIPANKAVKMVAILDTVIQTYLGEFNATVDAERAFQLKELQEQRDRNRQTLGAAEQ